MPELALDDVQRDALARERVRVSVGQRVGSESAPDARAGGEFHGFAGVRLSGYFGEASDLPQAVLQEFIDVVPTGEATVPIAKIYAMDEIATAHEDMEHDRVAGKLLVSTGR
jgi:NADPH:quinone reductase-like Zn-dependent oxidoreductase